MRKYLFTVILGSFLFGLSAMLGACATKGESQKYAQARAHTELAARYYQVGQIAVAVQEAQVALNSDASYIPAHTLLAVIYAELRQNIQADMHFQQALSLSEAQKISSTDLRNSYAWYLCQTDRASSGLSELSQVLRDPLYESMDKALVNAAVCSARVGRLDQANAYINAALDMHPDYGTAYLYRGHLAVQKEQWAAAKNDWQKAQQSLGETSATLWLAARIEHAGHNVLNSRKGASEQLTTQFPTSVEANWLRANRWRWF